MGIRNSLRIWNTNNGESITTFGENIYNYIAWRADERYIAAGNGHGDFEIWHRITTTHISPVISQHIDALSGIIWADDYIITISTTGTIQFWELRF